MSIILVLPPAIVAMKPGIFAGGRADLNSELAVQVAVTIVELNGEHVGNNHRRHAPSRSA